MRRELTKRDIFGLIAIALVIAGGITWHIVVDNRSAFDVVYTWARLNPIPASAQNIHLDTKGSAVSREFTLNFDAPPADIIAWLLASPGTVALTPSIAGGVRHYAITPGAGASFAEVSVDLSTGHVTVHTYWS